VGVEGIEGVVTLPQHLTVNEAKRLVSKEPRREVALTTVQATELRAGRMIEGAARNSLKVGLLLSCLLQVGVVPGGWDTG